MPFCHIRRTAQRPPDPAYPKSLTTLGDHIRKRRLDLGLLQSEVAKQIGVTESTVYNWESGAYNPETRYIPNIHDFLGYCPLRFPKTFGEKLRFWRESLGLSQKQLASGIGINETTLREWEIGLHKPMKQSLERVKMFGLNILCQNGENALK